MGDFAVELLNRPGTVLANGRVNSLDAWNVMVDDAFRGTCVDSGAARFEAELGIWECDQLRVIHIRAPSSKVWRWAAGKPNHRQGTALFHLQAAGTSISRQHGRAAPLAVGECTICAADEVYEVDFPDPYEMFVIEVPISAIVLQYPEFEIDGSTMQLLNISRSRLLLTFLQGAWDERDAMSGDGDWRDCVSQCATDLAIKTIGRSEAERTRQPRSELQRVVFDHIRSNLCDPDLRTSTIAEAVGVSRRSVQMVFERLATTPSDFILESRLRLAAKRLRDDPGECSITTIAFDIGFNDSSYFSRCFSHHYGMAPRDYRKRGSAAPIAPRERRRPL